MDVWADLVESWISRGDASEIQRLQILIAATRLGCIPAVDILAHWVCGFSQSDYVPFGDSFWYCPHVSLAMSCLRQRRRLLPLTVCERLMHVPRPGLGYAPIEAISAHADRSALDLLLRLHNDPSESDRRGGLCDAIEILGGRLGLSFARDGDALRVVSAT